MCRSSRGLSRLGVFWGLVALVTLLIVFVSGSWLYTKEPITFTKPTRATTISFRIGLWRVCPTIKKINASSTPSPACSLVKYSGWEEVRSTDLVTSSVPLEFTPVFITRMRSCTVLSGAAVVLLLLGFFFALLGHCNGDNKTLIACGMFILGGAANWPKFYEQCRGHRQSPVALPSAGRAPSKKCFPDFIRSESTLKIPDYIAVIRNDRTALLLGTGLVVFASTLSETLLDATQYHKEPPTGPVYDYRYGWCFFTAGAAFIMTKMAAVFSLSGYLNRFSSVDEMVRIMVPGAERKLREHRRLTIEFMDRHLCATTHQQRQQYDAVAATERTPKYAEPECGPLLNKTPPDVCTTNKCPEFSDGAGPGGAALLLEDTFSEANSLAGQTVPITVKNHHGSVSAGVSYAGFPPNKYGTTPGAVGGATLHQGFLGVSELGSSSSNSSSTYCARGKALQHQNSRPKKKCVKIETFQTPEQFADYGKRPNAFGYSGSAV